MAGPKDVRVLETLKRLKKLLPGKWNDKITQYLEVNVRKWVAVINQARDLHVTATNFPLPLPYPYDNIAESLAHGMTVEWQKDNWASGGKCGYFGPGVNSGLEKLWNDSDGPTALTDHPRKKLVVENNASPQGVSQDIDIKFPVNKGTTSSSFESTDQKPYALIFEMNQIFSSEKTSPVLTGEFASFSGHLKYDTSELEPFQPPALNSLFESASAFCLAGYLRAKKNKITVDWKRKEPIKLLLAPFNGKFMKYGILGTILFAENPALSKAVTKKCENLRIASDSPAQSKLLDSIQDSIVDNLWDKKKKKWKKMKKATGILMKVFEPKINNLIRSKGLLKSKK